MADICFFQGMQTQDRYLFLFNDLLLVAKQKWVQDSDTCSVNLLMHKVIKTHLKLKNFHTLSDPAQLSNSSTESESVSCG